MPILNPYLIPAITVSISLAAAVISYFNYRLNKTLNIKNQIFNEKLKKYIELSRKLAELIELLDLIGPTLNRFQSDKNNPEILLEFTEKVDKIGLEIEFLVIDSHMLVPQSVIEMLVEFAEMQNLGIPPNLSTVDPKLYWDQDNFIRTKAERLIKAFREDLSVDKLSISFAKKKHAQKT